MRNVRMYNPTHRFGTNDATPIRRPSLAWSKSFDGEIYEVAVWDGTVYVAVYDRVVALNQDGTEKWQFETGGKVDSSPAVVDGTVFFAAMDDRVYALDATTGKERWRWTDPSVEFTWRSTPAVVGRTVYVGSFSGSVYALDADSGRKVWEYEVGDYVLCSPAVVDGTVYVGAHDHRVHALGAVDGQERWTYETDDKVNGAPTVVDGTVYVGCDDGTLYALDSTNGREEWAYDTGSWVRSSPAVVDGTAFVDDTVYFTSPAGYFYALDADTGTERWVYESHNGAGHSSPTVVDDIEYVNGNKMYALDSIEGELQWQYSPITADSSPIASGDTVYAVGHNHPTAKQSVCAISSDPDASKNPARERAAFRDQVE